MEVEKVIDRKKVADSIHSVLEVGIELLHKDKLTNDDYAKIKVLRTLGPHINAGVALIQQETAQLRVAVVIERMKQLGYTVPKQLE